MKNIPNILSVSRIAMLPFLVQQLLKGNTLNAGLILLASAATDTLDGFLARHFGWVSDLGKVLDPIADKLTQAVVSVTLMFVMREYWFFFAIMILKDLVMLVLGGTLLKQGVKLEGARWFGKVSTVVYYAAMILIVLFRNLPKGIVVGLLSLAAVCALVSALLYIPEYLRYRTIAKEKKAEKDEKTHAKVS